MHDSIDLNYVPPDHAVHIKSDTGGYLLVPEQRRRGLYVHIWKESNTPGLVAPVTEYKIHGKRADTGIIAVGMTANFPHFTPVVKRSVVERILDFFKGKASFSGRLQALSPIKKTRSAAPLTTITPAHTWQETPMRISVIKIKNYGKWKKS